MRGDEERRSFPSAFDAEHAVGSELGNAAFYGLDVLRGLVSGIDDFINTRQERWRRYRAIGPALLGSAMWIDDPALIESLAGLSGASIIITKQVRTKGQLRRLEPLRLLNERTPGLPMRAFSELSGLAPKVNGRPPVIGPYDDIDDGWVPTLRTLGFRGARHEQVPILHAKLALLGHLWWHDEGASGHLEDIIGFSPSRLWISSANFTEASRRSLEFGYWTEDRELIAGAERFLVTAMRFSEELDPDADSFDPELAPVNFDDEAMREASIERDWDDVDEDPDYPG